jgi:hypothetical protein
MSRASRFPQPPTQVQQRLNGGTENIESEIDGRHKAIQVLCRSFFIAWGRIDKIKKLEAALSTDNFQLNRVRKYDRLNRPTHTLVCTGPSHGEIGGQIFIILWHQTAHGQE